MAIKDQIQQIISIRQLKGEKLKKKKETLQQVKDKLRECDQLYSQARQISDEKLRRQYMELFSTVQTKKVQRELDILIRRMNEGMKRFSRNYISIATVGRARQGKSQFLQNVGNLDNDIIPAYSATDCTGATSIIHNDMSQKVGEVKVKITFKQPEDLVRIVEGYIQGIDPSYLEDHPVEFDDIAYLPLSELELRVEEGNVSQATPLKHLTKIVEHFEEIRDLFGKSPEVMTDPELIRTYVAQNNGKSSDDPELERYYSYLAVQRADIYCRFYEDCGDIVLVDTVGLEDTQFGIEEAMLNTVDQECDAAIVVTKPIAGVHKTDEQIYNLLRDHFKNRRMDQWLFYAVNWYKGQNDNVVHAFKHDVENGNFAVCDCMIVDCSDPVDVRDHFVMPMLQKLVANMDTIDQAYLNEINELEKAFFKKYEAFIAELPEAKTFDPGAQEGIKAFLKGKDCYHKLAANLRNRVEYWNEEKDQPNSNLWNRVQKILNHMDDLPPSAEVLQKTINENGALLPVDLWHAALHYTRNEITDQFIAIDDVLEKETKEFKNSLVSDLYHELKNLSDGEGVEKTDEEDMVEWLKEMMDHVINDKPQYEQIHKAFQFLYQFEFNTRAQLIQEIRRQLYIINPICQEYAMPMYNFQRANAGKAVYHYLTSRLSVIEDDLRYSLSKLYRAPNQAFYAASEEFYDRLTFASNLKDGQFKSMDTVWGEFFMEYSKQLWQDNLEKYDEPNALVEKYHTILQDLGQLVTLARY